MKNETALSVLVAVVAVGAVAYWLIDRQEQEEKASLGPRFTAEECEARTYGLISPTGAVEKVPQRFVAAAVNERGYKFPLEVGVVFFQDKDLPNDPCESGVQGNVAEAPAFFKAGYRFRGWRKMKSDERQEADYREKFGEPEP